MSQINIHFHPTGFEDQLPTAFAQFREEELSKLSKLNLQNTIEIKSIDIRLEQNGHLGDSTYSTTINVSLLNSDKVFSANEEGKDYQKTVRDAVNTIINLVTKEKDKISSRH